MEDEEIQLFDEKEFEKQWQKNGMGNESMWSFFSSSYQQIVDTILRPMAKQGRPGRLLYDPLHDLGPVQVDVWPNSALKAVRQDHTMTCYGGKKIVFSVWRIQNNTDVPRPFVVYLHSAVGSRPEALQALHTSLRAGANFAALDFQGSGLSEGDIVTWGYYENNDVVDVVRYLLKLGTTTRIALWGRQLGAATALSYASRDPRVACLVLDTPYSSLDDQMDMVVAAAQKEGMSVPGIVLKAAKTMLQRSVRKKIAHKFDPNKLSPKYFAPKCKCHALIGSDKSDGVIPPKMVEKVFKKYSKKRRELVHFQCEGSAHFGVRPEEWLLKVHSFLLEHLYNKTKQNPTGTPPAAVPATVVAAAKWPPTWVATLNERLETNRSKAKTDAEAAALTGKKKGTNGGGGGGGGSSSSQGGETKSGGSDSTPPAPSTDATEDMMAVVEEDSAMMAALVDFEETAKY